MHHYILQNLIQPKFLGFYFSMSHDVVVNFDHNHMDCKWETYTVSKFQTICLPYYIEAEAECMSNYYDILSNFIDKSCQYCMSGALLVDVVKQKRHGFPRDPVPLWRVWGENAGITPPTPSKLPPTNLRRTRLHKHRKIPYFLRRHTPIATSIHSDNFIEVSLTR